MDGPAKDGEVPVEIIDISDEEPSFDPVRQEEQRWVDGILNARSAVEALGLTGAFTKTQVTSAYRRLSIRVHPDKNSSPGAHAAFLRLKEAEEDVLLEFFGVPRQNAKETDSTKPPKRPPPSQDQHRRTWNGQKPGPRSSKRSSAEQPSAPSSPPPEPPPRQPSPGKAGQGARATRDAGTQTRVPTREAGCQTDTPTHDIGCQTEAPGESLRDAETQTNAPENLQPAPQPGPQRQHRHQGPIFRRSQRPGRVGPYCFDCRTYGHLARDCDNPTGRRFCRRCGSTRAYCCGRLWNGRQ